jgi:hypothetical protein
MKAEIQPKKHIGLIFQPRSGSHVVRHYISEVTDRLNFGELFNPISNVSNYKLKREPFTGFEYIEYEKTSIVKKEINEKLDEAKKRVDWLNDLSNEDRYGIAGIYLRAFKPDIPSAVKIINGIKDIQFIRLDRADVLTSVLSLHFAEETGNFHNPVLQDKNHNPIYKTERVEIPVEKISLRLEEYVETQNIIKTLFPNIPTIYYEQFQNNVANLRNIFSGIPKYIANVPFNKLSKNYKELASNLNEIEDFYEQFVFEHQEFFPQYFGKIEGICIPSGQGRQPNFKD